MVKQPPNRSAVSTAIVAAASTRFVVASTPWALRAQPQGKGAAGAGIDAYVEAVDGASGEWLTIATIKADPTFDPTRVAEQIIHAVNNEETYRTLLDEMAVALEGCLACDGLDWSAEHDGEIMLDRYRAIFKK